MKFSQVKEDLEKLDVGEMIEDERCINIPLIKSEDQRVFI